MLETDGTGAMLASYVLDERGLVSQSRSGGDSYYLQDGQDSTRALTNAAGNVTDTYSYTAFGELFNQTGSTANSYLYTGQQFDALTGLYDLRARYYDPALGRFLSQDMYPYNFSNPVELNRYVYAGNDPLNKVDPTGNFADLAIQLGNTSKYIPILMAVGVAVLGVMAVIIAINALTPYVEPKIWEEPKVDVPPTTGSRLTEAEREALRQAVLEAIREAQQEPAPQPEPEKEPAPIRRPVPPIIPEGGKVSVYREVGSNKAGKPALNAGEFRVQLDGLSTFESAYLPGNKPFVVRFDLFEIGIEVIGSDDLQIAVGFIERLPNCFGIQTYMIRKGHWSLLCPGQNKDQMELTFSTYAKDNRTDVVGPNPAWKGSVP